MLAILGVQRALVAERAIDRLARSLEATADWIVIGCADLFSAQWWRQNQAMGRRNDRQSHD